MSMSSLLRCVPLFDVYSGYRGYKYGKLFSGGKRFSSSCPDFETSEIPGIRGKITDKDQKRKDRKDQKLYQSVRL